MPLDEVHAEDVNNLRPFLFIFIKKQIDQILHVGRVHLRQRLLFVLHDLENETK